jgi:nucleoside phosphorylase
MVTVTPVEGKAVLEVFQGATGHSAKLQPIADRMYHDLGDVSGTRVFLVQSQMGGAGLGAAQQTVHRGIEALSPDAVILVGIAFGVDRHKQSIGDILVARRLMLYEPQRVGTRGGKTTVVPRGVRADASPWLVDRCQNASLHWDESRCRVWSGLVLSGEKLVDNVTFREQLLEFEPEAIGGEMEGAGLYAACQDAKVDWILVKAICDWADGHKAASREERQQLAAHNATNFVLHVLRQAPLKHSQETAPQPPSPTILADTAASGPASCSASGRHAGGPGMQSENRKRQKPPTQAILIGVLLAVLVPGLTAVVAIALGYETIDDAVPVLISVLTIVGVLAIALLIRRWRRPVSEAVVRLEPIAREVRGRLEAALGRAIVDHDKLFGVDELSVDAGRCLCDPRRAWIISLFGEGGIGKTALAYEVVKGYGEQAGFTRFAWISAKQSHYSESGTLHSLESAQLQWSVLVRQLAGQLGLELGYSRTEWLDDFRRGVRSLPPPEKCLIVVDNLETVADADVIKYLDDPNKPKVSVINPHKVIVTTRRSIVGRSRNVVEIRLRGLKSQSACQLIRFLSRGNRDIELATDEDLKPILDVTEGNPLLMKLAVNRFLVSHRPLKDILDQLRGRDPQLKEYLYLQSLKELERLFGADVPAQLMRAFCPCLPTELLTYDQLLRYSGIQDHDMFRIALQLGCDLALIRVSGLDARYSIHSLLWEFVCGGSGGVGPRAR